MNKSIGIDLGTTNSCSSIIELGEPNIIVNGEGGRTTPSVVAFTKEGERLVGQSAKRQLVLNPDRTIASIKREMGSKNNITIDGKDYSPEAISALILGKLKKDAEEYIGEEVKDVVITVPAYFNDTQRKATQQAGEIAGFNVLRIINEPTAAALAYGKGQQKLNGTILVYDLGGGTFDVSVMDLEVDKDSEDADFYEVLSTTGDTKLGGDDFDQKLIDYICDEFKKDVGIDLRNDRQALQRVKEGAEKAKCELSTKHETDISLPFITTVEGEGPKHLEMTITRAKFESLIVDLLEKTLEHVNKALDDAGLSKEDIDKILLVGGSTRIPKVQEMLIERLGSKVEKGLNPDEVVSLGASIQANILSNGEANDLVLVDVTPLTLGIETMGDVCDVLIERNSSIPTRINRTYSTASDNQPAVEVHVLQGERKMASANKSLGRFHLTGLPPAPRGIPQIEVTFDMDANGVLNVSAVDMATKKEQSITITGSGQLSDDEVDTMTKDAEQYAAEDAQFAELAKAHNEADQMLYQMKTTLTEMEEQMSPEDKANIEGKLLELEGKKDSDNVEEIRQAIDELNQAFSSVAQKVYEQAAATQEVVEQEKTGTEAKVDENIIDAEFEATEG